MIWSAAPHFKTKQKKKKPDRFTCHENDSNGGRNGLWCPLRHCCVLRMENHMYICAQIWLFDLNSTEMGKLVQNGSETATDKVRKVDNGWISIKHYWKRRSCWRNAENNCIRFLFLLKWHLFKMFSPKHHSRFNCWIFFPYISSHSSFKWILFVGDLPVSFGFFRGVCATRFFFVFFFIVRLN